MKTVALVKLYRQMKGIIARGSLNETLKQLIDTNNCKYIANARLIYFRSPINEVERLLNGYIH